MPYKSAGVVRFCKSFKMRSALVALLICNASVAHADYQFAVNLEALYFDYEEVGEAGSLNEETGWLPGLSLNMSKTLGSYSLGLDAGLYSGSVVYDGETQGGTDLQTRTEQQIYRVAGYLQWQPPESQFGLYARLGYWQWKRDIQPTSGTPGLFERYHWQFIEAGLSATLWQSDRRSVFLDIGYAHIYDAEVDVDLRPFGFGQANLTLGDASHGVITRLGFKMPWSVSDHLELALTHRYWNLKQSEPGRVGNGPTVLTVKEPESRANHMSISLSYVHSF